ncbi:AAA family ATPase [Salicibibacter cibi]|uniref:AAA family ATPase n=1 Tax=Salicibibacter cibi TaxID=2743001 RepID=A0A7T6ZBG7_9BACI|nr:AAA family ATPase [Salicibibacter cibi]QQK80445.1 AAA family ATPase [Salicibibacter cibi]
MSNHPHIYEFIGMPGSGKTTVAGHVINHLKADGYSVPSIKEIIKVRTFKLNRPSQLIKYISFFFFCLVNVLLFYKVLTFSSSVKPRNTESYIYSIVLMRHLYYIRTLKKKNYDIIIMDEGTLQYVWSIVLSGDSFSKARLTKLVRALSKKNDVNLLFMSFDAKSAADRVKKRNLKSGRINLLSSQKLESLLTYHQKSMDIILENINQIKPSLKRIKGGKPINEKVHTVLNIVEFNIK